MRKALENLYYGNITPGEQQMAPGSGLKRAVDCVACCKKQLEEMLNETRRMILIKLVRSEGFCQG